MARKISEEGETDVDEEVSAATTNHEDTDGWDWKVSLGWPGWNAVYAELTEDGDEDDEDGGDGVGHCARRFVSALRLRSSLQAVGCGLWDVGRGT